MFQTKTNKVLYPHHSIAVRYLFATDMILTNSLFTFYVMRGVSAVTFHDVLT